MKAIKLLGVLVFTCFLIPSSVFSAGGPEKISDLSMPTIPEVNVRFAIGPYADGSYSIIGSQQGWFKELGITLKPEPHGAVIDASQWGHLLVAGTADITQNHTKTFVPVLPETMKQKMFLFADMSLGNAILGDPDKYKSLEEFIAEGNSTDEAYQKTIAQLKGKEIPCEINPANKGMLSYAFGRAGMDLDKDVKLLLIEDPKVLAMMLSGQADVAAPSGIPTIVQLVLKGFKPLVSNGMEIKYANIAKESEVLQTTLFAGIASTDDWLKKNHDTALRFCSVYYRIIDLIVNSPDKAVAIHLPFINGIAGTNLGAEELKTIYRVTQPFRAFEQQSDYYSKESPFYWENVIMEDIKMWEQKGVLPKGKYKPSDVNVSNQFYNELVQLKSETETLVKQAKEIIDQGKGTFEEKIKTSSLLERAEYYYRIRDYLDARNFAKACLKLAQSAK